MVLGCESRLGILGSPMDAHESMDVTASGPTSLVVAASDGPGG
jgi:hypothetical protein